MRMRFGVGVCTILLAAGIACVHAQDKPGEMKPADVSAAGATAAEAAPAQRRLGRLTQPWNRIVGLSEEQKTRIREIHAAAIAEIHRIEAREKQDVMALLSDEQKVELKKIEEEARASRKTRSGASTQPASAAE